MRNNGQAHKKDEFLAVYDDHFKDWKDKDVRFLEIGVQYGGSLQIWKEYFTGNLDLIGVDVLPECKKYETTGVKIFIGNQGDVDFLDGLGEFDIIVDDGGHSMNQQQISFDTLFPKLSPGGIYVIEDIHTSYWRQFLDRKKTTVEFCKDLIEDLNAEARKSGRNEDFPELKDPLPIESIHFYESLVVIHKKCISNQK